MLKIYYILFLGLLFGLTSCFEDKKHIDISSIQVDQKYERFDQDLFQIPHDSIWDYVPMLSEKYGHFFEAYNHLVIKIGGINQLDYDEKLLNFLTDPYIAEAYKDVQKLYPEFTFQTELTNAFKRIKYFYPEKTYPNIYTHMSGFNQSIVIDSGYLSISLDKYLGVESKFYSMLRVSNYLRQNMHSKKIVSDAIYAYLITEFPMQIENPSLVDQMIYFGKIQCFMDDLLPETADSLKWGISHKKLEWCQKNERKMWLYLVENKLLFSTQVNDIRKFIDEGPFTASFSKESPAKTGQWLGYKIVKSYLKQNSNVSYQDLLINHDHRSILNQSKYKP